MAFNASTRCYCDGNAGNDSNAGIFNVGASGTNYPLAGTSFAYTDITIVSGASFTVSSVNRPFIAADVGNGVRLNTVGSGSGTTGCYQIASVSTGIATLDRTPGTTGAVFSAAVLGGAVATVQFATDTMYFNAGAVGDTQVYAKNAAYAGTLAIGNNGHAYVSNGLCRAVLAGYNTTFSDAPTIASGNQPTYSVGSGAGVPGWTNTITGLSLFNFSFIGTATSGTRGTIGVNHNCQISDVKNVRVFNFSGVGMQNTSGVGTMQFSLCESTGNGGNGVSCGKCQYIWSHKNTGIGFNQINGGDWSSCITTNNAGGGIGLGYNTSWVDGLSFGNTGAGCDPSAFNGGVSIVVNSIFAKNTTYGMNNGGVNLINLGYDYNAFYANGTAAYNNGIAGPHDVVLVGTTPFNQTDANNLSETSPDWTLNSTAGAGANLRGVGFPGSFPGMSTASYRDIGPFQHQDAGGGGGAVPRQLLLIDGPGLSASFRG